MSIVILPKRKALRLTCQKCEYSWIYTGVSKFRASCPHCGSTIRLTHKGSTIATSTLAAGNNRDIQIHSKNANDNEKPLRMTPRVGRHVEQSPLVKARFTRREESVPSNE